MIDRVRASYDAVAERYAKEIGGELPGKPVDRALYGLFAELIQAASGEASPALVGDVGCGPGHVTAYLNGLGLTVVGIDLSPKMIDLARHTYPLTNQREFRTGDMTVFGGLGDVDGAWAGAVCPYSIVHFDADQRRLAFTELARVIRPGGWLLVAFHISTAGEQAGAATIHRDTWWGHTVDLDFRLIDPADVVAELTDTGFVVESRTDREPTGVEAPTRRSYLLARRDGISAVGEPS